MSAVSRLLVLAAVLNLVVMGRQAASAQSDAPQSTEAIASDIKPEALWDGRKLAPFRSIDNPPMVAASQADFLDDSEYVLGLNVNGDARAYPTRFVWFHHAVNDTVGKQESGGPRPVGITYCSVCNTGIAYYTRLGDRTVMLDFYGLYNGVVTLCDRETASVFLQVEGRAVKGKLLGTQLKMVTLLDTTWGQWKKLHPDTVVMSPETSFKRFYRPKDKPEPRGYPRFPAPYFQPTVTRGDLRIPPFAKVLGVIVEEPGEKSKPLRRAYPIESLKDAGGAVNDRIGKTPVAVLFDPDTAAAVALDRRLDGKTLDFKVVTGKEGKRSFVDNQTGTNWSLEGTAVEGPLAGKSLARIDNHLSQWYGWSAYYPDTTVFGRKDAPMPGNPFDAKVVASAQRAPSPIVQNQSPKVEDEREQIYR